MFCFIHHDLSMFVLCMDDAFVALSFFRCVELIIQLPKVSDCDTHVHNVRCKDQT